MTRRIVMVMLTMSCWLTPAAWGQAIPNPTPSPTQTVFFSEHGKTYHAKTTCFALSRTTEVFQSTLKDAEAHGLKQCHICFRTRKTQPSAQDWAKPSKENEKR